MVMNMIDIEKRFSEKGIPVEMYWLGPEEGAEMQNGLKQENGKWLVYYRERGQLLNCEYYDSQDEAVMALEGRLLRLLEFYKSYGS